MASGNDKEIFHTFFYSVKLHVNDPFLYKRKGAKKINRVLFLRKGPCDIVEDIDCDGCAFISWLAILKTYFSG